MAEETRQIPTYKPGDKIRLEVEASDESGVAEVIAEFDFEGESSSGIALFGDGRGQRQAKVTLVAEVPYNATPGKYNLFYIALTDTRGNQSVVARPGELSFRVDNAGDFEGPRLDDYRFT